MLIKLNELQNKYNINPINVIHIGAHDGQEYKSYKDIGVKNIVWIEANPEISNRLSKKFESEKNTKVINALITDVDNQEFIFNITNNEQSSSILELGKHKNLYPNIFYTKKISLFSKTIDTLVKEHQIKEKFDFMNIDVQGAELLVLKGAKNTLKTVKAVYTEINTDYVYKDCALIDEIDSYLFNFDFKRVETKMHQDHPWGDALYLKTI